MSYDFVAVLLVIYTYSLYLSFLAISGGEQTGDDDVPVEIVSAEEEGKSAPGDQPPSPRTVAEEKPEEEGQSATLDQPPSPRTVAQEKPEPLPSAELETTEKPPTQPGK